MLGNNVLKGGVQINDFQKWKRMEKGVPFPPTALLQSKPPISRANCILL
jgi:hypothetical protein